MDIKVLALTRIQNLSSRSGSTQLVAASNVASAAMTF